MRDLGRPAGGWIRLVRQALHMPQRELARRLGVTQATIAALEAREVTGAVTIDALERAATALDCDLVYALIPRRSLEEVLHEQAASVARAQWHAVSQSMVLEDQAVEENSVTLEALTRAAMHAGTAAWPADG